MIRLTLTQIQDAEQAAVDVMTAVSHKDSLPPGPMVPATSRAGLPLSVPREMVVSQLDAARDDALARLKALGIDFDPAG